METSELLKQVRRIEIKTRGLSNQIFSGEYHSAFKGRGMAFSEVREYQHGDDIRSIDWNVTARLNAPYIKIYEEERELTVMLMADVSASSAFGTKKYFKRDLITEICAVLAFSAIQNNDKIGVIFFSDQIEKFIPPKKGRSHILRIIRELIEFTPTHSGTNLSQALQYVSNVIKKRCTTFVISDFMDSQFEQALKLANKKHDIVALQIYDEREAQLPDAGMVRLRNAESNETLWIDTSSKKVRDNYSANWLKKQNELKQIFAKAGVDVAKIKTDGGYVTPLMNLFKKREVK